LGWDGMVMSESLGGEGGLPRLVSKVAWGP
jgi:hypothetical protein